MFLLYFAQLHTATPHMRYIPIISDILDGPCSQHMQCIQTGALVLGHADRMACIVSVILPPIHTYIQTYINHGGVQPCMLACMHECMQNHSPICRDIREIHSNITLHVHTHIPFVFRFRCRVICIRTDAHTKLQWYRQEHLALSATCA